MKLTDTQKELLLYLGGPEEDDRVLSLEVHDELVKLGLLYKRDDGPWASAQMDKKQKNHF